MSTPDLASAARALADGVMGQFDPVPSWDREQLLRAAGRVFAALAAHDQQDEPKCLHTGDEPNDTITGRPPCQRPKGHDGLCSQWPGDGCVPGLGDDESEQVQLAMVPLPGNGRYSVTVEHQADHGEDHYQTREWEVWAEDGNVRVEPVTYPERQRLADSRDPVHRGVHVMPGVPVSAPGPDQALSVRVACGVPEEEDLWIATWLFQSPLSSRTSGAHDPAGYGFSGLLGEIRRARAEYARLREAGEVGS